MTLEKDFSYFSGLFQTDGHLSEDTRNRGKFRLELNKKDCDIIHKIKNILDSKNVKCSTSERTRKTNFGISNTATLNAYELQFRRLLNNWGVTVGKKSNSIKPPLHKKELSIDDYIRGLYDGDGSLGYTSNNFPFVSLVTKSEVLKEFILNFISEITMKHKKQLKRNKRDNVYNIMITKEDAVLFCKKVYPKNCLSINRKYKNAQKITKWKRPHDMRIVEGRKNWNKVEDEFVLSHSIAKSEDKLDRTEQSIKMRLWRLSKIN